MPAPPYRKALPVECSRFAASFETKLEELKAHILEWHASEICRLHGELDELRAQLSACRKDPWPPGMGTKPSAHHDDGPSADQTYNEQMQIDNSETCGQHSRVTSSLSLYTDVDGDLQATVVTQTSCASSSIPAHEKIFTAGDDQEVQNLVETSWDPNRRITNITLMRKEYLHLTPLSVAVLRRRPELATWLVSRKADPNSNYSFLAGAENMPWCGTCAHAAVPKGNLEMLKLLASLRADLHRQGSNGATLMWQAAYFNQKDIAEFLMREKADLEAKATSQDNEEVCHTPLHAAVQANNVDMVSMLLSGKACVAVHDRDPSSVLCRDPLLDAIMLGHADVAKILVESSANLLSRVHRRMSTSPMERLRVSRQDRKGSRLRHSVSRTASSMQSSGTLVLQSALDVIFQLHNPIVTAAVAKGMQNTPHLLNNLTRKSLVYLLRSSGDTPKLIMESIFRPYPIAFWDEQDGRRIRNKVKTAFLRAGTHFNVAKGPHKETIATVFENKSRPGEDVQRFMKIIAPQRPQSKADRFAAVTFAMCHVPEVHEDLDVLLAIADCRSRELFTTPGCLGILMLAARGVHIRTKIRLIIAIIEVFDLLLLVGVLNIAWLRKAFSTIVTSLASAVFILDLFTFLASAVGYWVQGVLSRFLREWFNLAILIMYGVILVFTWKDVNFRSNDFSVSPTYRTLLGMVVFIKCMQLLLICCQFRFFGVRILPIISVFNDIGPFSVVMCVCMFSAAAMYYALGVRDLMRSFSVVYRLILLQEVNMAEMESVVDPEMTVASNGFIVQTSAAKTEYHYIIQFLMMFVSFTMSLTLMNLFIAVLNHSYQSASNSSEVLYVRNKVHFLLDALAIKSAAEFAKDVFFEYVEDFYPAWFHHARPSPNSRSSRYSRNTYNSKASRLMCALDSSCNADAIKQKGDHNFLWVCIPVENVLS